MDDLLSDFIAETREGLEALDSELVRFEQKPSDPETLGGIFRLIHTIKGTCGFLGLARLQHVAHAAENVLGAFRDGALPVTPPAVSAVLDTVDIIRVLINALEENGVEPEGDDDVLIARLEALLEAARPAAPETAAPAAQARLIDRLGGDATLDAAAEMALERMRSDPKLGGAFVDVDPDRLQGGLRDSLCRLARGAGDDASGFVAALTQAVEGPLAVEAVAAAFDTVASALAALDVSPSAIAELRLRALATPPPPVQTGEASPPEGPTATEIVAPAPREPSRSGPNVSADGAAAASQTIRVSVEALEDLMTVVSELVLIRNQLIQTLRLEPESPFAGPLHRLNQVTSELQERVMTTRMQPISGAWAKLPRLVRDLAQELGKSIELVMHGQETELDRQVLELIRDPLTHMIRNAADHGLETPAERSAAGKSPRGRITLQARHEGGAIVIEVNDDGRGLSAERIRSKALSQGLVSAAQSEQMTDADIRQLIFLAGFSTAPQVTAVSGRGVGMDVVRTNIEKIGGAIEVASTEGEGTRFTIRIPLTLTIVSALIVESCGERFAMPQSAVVELVSASGASGRTIEYIDGAAVLRLRDGMLPLVSLQSVLGLDPAAEPPGEACIVVARVGAFTFGLIVDRVFDTEEIVVKPVATVLRHLRVYSGATILGDGSVILILDPKGMSLEAAVGQTSNSGQEAAPVAPAEAEERTTLLVFRAANRTLRAAPLASVSRIEEVSPGQVERVHGRTVIQYRGALMPVLGADAEAAVSWEGAGRRPLLVFARGGRAVGLLVDEIVDIVDGSTKAQLGSSAGGGEASLIIAGEAAELIDVDFYWRRALGARTPENGDAGSPPSPKRLLVVDSSPFSQMLLRPLLSQAGYDVVVAPDPEVVLALYQAGERFHLIMADTRRDVPDAEAFARAFSAAEAWHETPLLGVALHKTGHATARSFDATTVLEAVTSALATRKNAA